MNRKNIIIILMSIELILLAVNINLVSFSIYLQNLAGQVSSEMNGLVKRAQEETGLGADSDLIDQFSQTQEQVITTSLKDWKVSEKEIQEERSNNQNIYRAYVLIEWDEGAANKRLLQKIKEDEKLYTLMRSTELFEEMDKKVEKYRKRYNK